MVGRSHSSCPDPGLNSSEERNPSSVHTSACSVLSSCSGSVGAFSNPPGGPAARDERRRKSRILSASDGKHGSPDRADDVNHYGYPRAMRWRGERTRNHNRGGRDGGTQTQNHRVGERPPWSAAQAGHHLRFRAQLRRQLEKQRADNNRREPRNSRRNGDQSPTE